MSLLLEMKGITKEFPGVKALDNVKLKVDKGEVHVLLGENGAGKSTLIKILAGVHQPTKGQIFIDGKEVSFRNTKDAQNHGVGIIFQELNLIPDLTVADNIFFGRSPHSAGFVKKLEQINRAQEILTSLDLKISPNELVKNLSIAEQQMIEIAKALSINSRILIMDEPTAALTDQEITVLFEKIKALKAKGVAIIYISHRMEEFEHIADRITVLRDGKYIGTVNYKDTTNDELIKMMVGRTLEEQYPKDETIPIGDEILRVKNLSTKDKLKNISFSLRKGEILGISGLMGAGRTELAKAIFGADPVTKGEIFVEGKKANIKSPNDAIKSGISYLSEDRKSLGLALSLSVRENITLASMESVSNNGVINRQSEAEKATRYKEKLNIKTPSIEQKARNLSGGNQQKVVIAKWLNTNTKIFIFDEPTRGIDVGAKIEVYEIINQLAREGNGVILISSDMPELLGMSDNILVMSEGKVTGKLPRSEASQEKIMQLAAAANV